MISSVTYDNWKARAFSFWQWKSEIDKEREMWNTSPKKERCTKRNETKAHRSRPEAQPCLGFWERKLFFLLSLTRSWKLSGVKATLDSFHFGTSYHIPTNKCRKERIYQSGLMAREAVCHSDYESTKPGRASRSLSGDVSLSDVSQSRMISAAQFSTQRGNWNPFIPPSPSEEKRSLLSLC